jgi:hypothetical protein
MSADPTARLSPEREAEIAARTEAATPGPWFLHDDWPGRVFSESQFNHHIARVTGTNPESNERFIAHAREDVPALLAEIQQLRSTLTTLADRWDQMATTGDAAIGTFPGPAAATIDAEVGERGRTYRKAASDVRDTLRTGRIPHDLMTDAELDEHGTTTEPVR